MLFKTERVETMIIIYNNGKSIQDKLKKKKQVLYQYYEINFNNRKRNDEWDKLKLFHMDESKIIKPNIQYQTKQN